MKLVSIDGERLEANDNGINDTAMRSLVVTVVHRALFGLPFADVCRKRGLDLADVFQSLEGCEERFADEVMRALGSTG